MWLTVCEESRLSAMRQTEIIRHDRGKEIDIKCVGGLTGSNAFTNTHQYQIAWYARHMISCQRCWIFKYRNKSNEKRWQMALYLYEISFKRHVQIQIIFASFSLHQRKKERKTTAEMLLFRANVGQRTIYFVCVTLHIAYTCLIRVYK